MSLIAKDVKSVKHGVKTALLLGPDKSRIMATFAEGCVAAFEPSSLEEGATRLSLDLRGSDDFISFFDVLDEKVRSLLVAGSSEYFGKTLGHADIERLYTPCVKRKGSYEPTVRTKLRTDGLSATQAWNTAGEACELPTRWRGVRLGVRVCVSHLWITKTAVGVTVFLEDVELSDEVVRRSPFAKSVV